MFSEAVTVPVLRLAARSPDVSPDAKRLFSASSLAFSMSSGDASEDMRVKSGFTGSTSDGAPIGRRGSSLTGDSGEGTGDSGEGAGVSGEGTGVSGEGAGVSGEGAGVSGEGTGKAPSMALIKAIGLTTCAPSRVT